MNWTREQQNAIEARGGSLLVSAGAGSGKTAVLTERVVSLLADPVEPVDADRLLIVTYTRAAAGEMRSRISKRLSQLLEENPQNGGLRRQLSLLDQAQISTVHSFCRELILENFQHLGVAPDFRLCDEKELDLWRGEAVAMVVEQAYETEDSGFHELVELLSTGRDDAALQRTVVTLYEFVRSHPFYQSWLTEKLAIYRSVTDVLASPWGEIIWNHAEGAIRFGLGRVQQGIELMREDEKIRAAYGPCFVQYEAQYQELLACHASRDWDSLYQRLSAFAFPALGRLTKYEDTAKKNQVTALRDWAKNTVEDLRKIFCASAQEFLDDIADLTPKMERLFALTIQYGQQLDDIKRRHRALDFSDLEHYALGLLVEKTDTGHQFTEYAAGIARQYAQVFVDEYQDTNEVQELIFQAVSGGEQNLFMVGDVKQSIYRFRQAMPEIFLSKKRRFAPYDGVAFPAQIDLSRNFRSTPRVIDGINFFFDLLMSEDMGEIDYHGGEALIAGLPDLPGEDPAVELHLIDTSDDESDRSSVQLEARHVAGAIGDLMRSGYQINDGGVLRPIEPKDVCILMRSPRTKAVHYLDALEEQGIQALAEAQRGFLTSREVSSVLALLQVVDNPLQDIHLVAALLSPVYAFTPEEVAEIRLVRRRGDLYPNLVSRAEQGDEHCRAFLRDVAELRTLAATLPTDQLLIRLLDLTGFEAVARTLEGGQQRLQNLRLLVQYAAEYESRGYRGLSSFLRFTDRLLEEGEDLTEASVLDGENHVRIMSIHKSKGLEFPVVFVVDTAKAFNTEDLRRTVLLHSTLGFACIRRDFRTFQQFSTVPMQALKLDLTRSAKSEELRVLYVAMTRARQKLILTGVLKNPERKLASLAGDLDEDGRIPAYRVADGRSYLDWVLMAALSHPDGQELRARFGLESTQAPSGSRLSIQLTEPAPDQEVGETTALEYTAPVDEELLAKLRAQTNFAYPCEDATRIPNKLAISEIAHRQGGAFHFATKPAFVYDEGLTPSERGNAHHKFMQFCDYGKAAADPEAEVLRLRGQGFLTAAEADAIEPARIRTFFESGLASRIFASDSVEREFRFLAEVGEELLSSYTSLALGDNKTTLQGVADCVFFEEDGAVIVDYKTDRVSSPDDLVERYRTQLELYRHLIGEATGVPVKACVIYSFHLGCEIPVYNGENETVVML